MLIIVEINHITAVPDRIKEKFGFLRNNLTNGSFSIILYHDILHVNILYHEITRQNKLYNALDS